MTLDEDKPMKYALFNGPTYYPGGGWDDYVGMFETIADAIAKADKSIFMWWHVVDLELKVVVSEGTTDP